MTVVIAVDKRCAASGRALQAESAASEIQRAKKYIFNTLAEKYKKKIHSRKTFNIEQMHARKTVCGDEFATILCRNEFVFIFSPSTNALTKGHFRSLKHLPVK